MLISEQNSSAAHLNRAHTAPESIASGWWRQLWALLLLLAVFGAQAQTGVVSRVIDGDTIWIKTAPGRKPLKVRIAGIDAPEICQSGGLASRDALRRRLLGQTVTMIQTSYRRHDDYGRLLASIDLKGEDVGRWMVSSGYAWSYHFRRNPGPYAAEQGRAKAAGRGLFAQTAPENPRQFRQQHGSCHP
ncbi:MAG: thermonuclease family protein [Polaromonas sp.]|nr:thermonuclease family protein [Polaromonas sp.]